MFKHARMIFIPKSNKSHYSIQNYLPIECQRTRPCNWSVASATRLQCYRQMGKYLHIHQFRLFRNYPTIKTYFTVIINICAYSICLLLNTSFHEWYICQAGHLWNRSIVIINVTCDPRCCSGARCEDEVEFRRGTMTLTLQRLTLYKIIIINYIIILTFILVILINKLPIYHL